MAARASAAPGPTPLSISAAQYVRVSTEHQRYSARYQIAAIAEYAAARGIEIVRTYLDERKSGLTLRLRPGLQQLLADVVGDGAGYQAILVYDVSRWGRFQDIDECAHYEFLCRNAGVAVRYCAESFENDGSAVSAIFKAARRVMAADFSRDLSVRVCHGIRLSAAEGYHFGPTPYGFRRMLLDAEGIPKGKLERGEHKYLRTDKVILVPGPAEEQQIVRSIFGMYVEDRLPVREIVRRLAATVDQSSRCKSWSDATVRGILRNEIYVGTLVFGKTSQRLRGKVTPTSQETWIRNEGVVAPLIDRATFSRAQEIRLASPLHLSNEEIVARLKALHARVGRITQDEIRKSPDLPNETTIRKRLGGTDRMYSLVGAARSPHYRSTTVTKLIRHLEQETVRRILELPPSVVRVKASDDDTVLLRDTVSVRIYAARPSLLASGDWRWRCKLATARRADWNLVIRCDPPGDGVLDYLLLPRWEHDLGHLTFDRDLERRLASYHVVSFDELIVRLSTLRRPRRPELTHGLPSRYAPLGDYLRDIGEDNIVLTIAEIMQIVGGELPRTASTWRWWSNSSNRKRHSSQANAWMKAGYTADFSPATGLATFRRITKADGARTGVVGAG